MDHHSSTNPWFKDGLRFRCTMCGHCCTGAPGFVWINDDEVGSIAEYLGLSTDQFLNAAARAVGERRSLKEMDNGDCIFYDREQGCTIYPVRPRQCRTWPFWESNVRSPEAWERTCQVCPGSGRGDLIPPEEITRRRKVIEL